MNNRISTLRANRPIWFHFVPTIATIHDYFTSLYVSIQPRRNWRNNKLHMESGIFALYNCFLCLPVGVKVGQCPFSLCSCKEKVDKKRKHVLGGKISISSPLKTPPNWNDKGGDFSLPLIHPDMVRKKAMCIWREKTGAAIATPCGEVCLKAETYQISTTEGRFLRGGIPLLKRFN